jgi:hypothetical protein
VTGELEPLEQDDRDEVADVEARRRGIEARIHRDDLAREQRRESFAIGDVGQESSLMQVVEQRHRTKVPRSPPRRKVTEPFRSWHVHRPGNSWIKRA